MGRREGESIEEWSRRRRLESRTPAEVARDAENEQARKNWASKPLAEKPLTSCSFMHATKPMRKGAEETIAFWAQDQTDRKPEPTEKELRRAVQASHPDRGGDPDAFIAAKKALDKKRSRK